jgi:hypothetical protein
MRFLQGDFIVIVDHIAKEIKENEQELIPVDFGDPISNPH